MAGSDEDFEMILVANKKLKEENQRLENLVADYLQGRTRNMKLLQEKQELVDDYGQRLTKDNELMIRQHKKIEELQNRGNELLDQRLKLKKAIEFLKTELTAITSTFDAREKYTRKLQIENKQSQAVCEAAKELRIITMVNTTESYDYISIEKAKWDVLQQTIAEKEE